MQLLTGCTEDADPAAPTRTVTAPASADPAVARTTVDHIGTNRAVTVTAPEFTAEQGGSLAALADVPRKVVTAHAVIVDARCRLRLPRSGVENMAPC